MNIDQIKHTMVTYKHQEVKIKDIIFCIKRNDSISSPSLEQDDFLQVLTLVNQCQSRDYQLTLFGNPLTMMFC